MSRGHACVCWSVSVDTAVVLPLVSKWGAAHRGDVDATDEVWPFVPIKRPIIRAGDPLTVTRRAQTIVGAVSPALIARIAAALAREAQARAFETGAWRAMARPMRAMGCGG